MAARQPTTGAEPTESSGAGRVFIHFTMSLDGFIAGPLPRPIILRPVSVGQSGDATTMRFSCVRSQEER